MKRKPKFYLIVTKQYEKKLRTEHPAAFLETLFTFPLQFFLVSQRSGASHLLLHLSLLLPYSSLSLYFLLHMLSQSLFISKSPPCVFIFSFSKTAFPESRNWLGKLNISLRARRRQWAEKNSIFHVVVGEFIEDSLFYSMCVFHYSPISNPSWQFRYEWQLT